MIARAGGKHPYRWERIAIEVGAVMLGHTLFNQHHPRDPRPDPGYIHRPPPHPRFYGDSEMRRIWIPPVYEKVWNPGHRNHNGRWVPGRWIEVVKEPGHWCEKREWVGRFHHRRSH